MSLPDPVAHIRESFHGWITSTDEATIRALLKVRRYLDSNLRRPIPPTGWIALSDLATRSGRCPGHLARICRETLAAQDLAKQCTHKGRITWFLSPEACATIAPSDTDTDTGSAIAYMSPERHPGIDHAVVITGADAAPSNDVTRDRSTSNPAAPPQRQADGLNQAAHLEIEGGSK